MDRRGTRRASSRFYGSLVDTSRIHQPGIQNQLYLKIPIYRKVSNSVLEEQLLLAAERVIRSGQYVLGPEVHAFERDFAHYCQSQHCLTVGNGTEALGLALKAVGVQPGQSVILAANAGFYGSVACYMVGACPRYVDIDPASRCLDPKAVAAEMDSSVGAILVTHLYGQLADVDELLALADQFGVPMLEDCAQAHGARLGGRPAGSFGKVGCFSFYPTKNLGALGDGGALVTSDSGVAECARKLRQYGWSRKYHVELPGGVNSRLDEMQAAFLNVKLPYLDGWNESRRQIAFKYHQRLHHLPLQLPSLSSQGADNYVGHLYVVATPERERLRLGLLEQGIGCEIHYPVADFAQPAYPLSKQLPNTLAHCAQVLTLPCFPGMSGEEIDLVADVVCQLLE